MAAQTFPVEKVLFQLVNFCISLIAVAIVMIFFQIPPTINIIALPLLLFYVTLFSLGIGLALSALAVFFRDICHLWSVLITAWTYATPLFYPISIIPEWLLPIMQANPMYHYVTYFRDIVLWNTFPSIEENLLCFGIALISLLVGVLIVRKTQSKFILYV